MIGPASPRGRCPAMTRIKFQNTVPERTSSPGTLLQATHPTSCHDQVCPPRLTLWQPNHLAIARENLQDNGPSRWSEGKGRIRAAKTAGVPRPYRSGSVLGQFSCKLQNLIARDFAVCIEQWWHKLPQKNVAPRSGFCIVVRNMRKMFVRPIPATSANIDRKNT